MLGRRQATRLHASIVSWLGDWPTAADDGASSFDGDEIRVLGHVFLAKLCARFERVTGCCAVDPTKKPDHRITFRVGSGFCARQLMRARLSVRLPDLFFCPQRWRNGRGRYSQELFKILHSLTSTDIGSHGDNLRAIALDDCCEPISPQVECFALLLLVVVLHVMG
jgi:hypothetical protein